MWSLLHVTLLLLLLCSYLNACFVHAEHTCGFGRRKRSAGEQPVTVVREVSRAGQGAWQAYTAATADGWAPLRVLVSTVDLENENQYCTASMDARPDFEGSRLLCGASQVLTAAKKAILTRRSIPEAVKLHTDRLLVKPVTGHLVVPIFSAPHICTPFSIPASHHNPGVTDHDMVLYVAAGPTSESGVVAWAISCASIADGRPAVGVMNFSPNHIADTLRVVRIAAHEMAHALGFESEVFLARGMLTFELEIRGKKNISALTSKRAVEMARKHYNCDTAIGIELEDEGGDGTALSHFERRNAKDELMAGVNGIGFYSVLTLSAFEDTGFYVANWSMAEPMAWGNNSGCELLTGKCVENGVTRYPHMFCTDTDTDVLQCTSHRLALGYCYLSLQESPLPSHFNYFVDPRKGGPDNALMDYCPLVAPAGDPFWCTTGDEGMILSSIFGPDSVCLKGKSLMMEGTRVGDVCAEVRCTTTGVLVRYRGDDEWYTCPEGRVLRPRVTFSSGGIVCPKYDEVCTVAPDGSSRINGEVRTEAREKGDVSQKNLKGNNAAAGGLLPHLFDNEKALLLDRVTEKHQSERKRNSDGSIAAALLMSVLFVFIATSVLMAP
ncbi:surface protease GP63 [Trypanosoma grayi]|uniref:surface protease GP63 n=1 Tax=Trypanosoma grayi TaxID=71804 RepID=UPI0004F4451D|nr:surface protease GP63 [Trypanosoma grayi]KEG14470.1 surface protease GP63 [Trypanosoma grayi]